MSTILEEWLNDCRTEATRDREEITARAIEALRAKTTPEEFARLPAFARRNRVKIAVLEAGSKSKTESASIARDVLRFMKGR